ncbi:MAG: ABC transporter permease, partial [Spirochaetales bacterium]|nr:ABC transporter permease [Spirochaetales bacterium]
MNSARIAFRNLSRQKKRSFLLGGAIAFGILIISLVNSFTAGVVENVQENFSHFLAGHIFLTGYEKSPSGRVVSVIRDDAALTEAIRRIEQDSLRYIAKRSSLNGVLIFEGENTRQQVVGVDWDEERYLRDRLVLREGTIEAVLAEPRALVLNEKAAERLGVAVGETLLVQMQTVTGQQNVGEFILAATSVDTGIFSSMSAYGHRGHVNTLVNIEPEEYITLGIFLEDMGRMDLEAQRLYQALQDRVSLFPRAVGPQAGGPQAMRGLMTQMAEEEWEGTRYQLATISDYLQPLNQIASTLNIVGLVVVLILFVIIMVGITNTFRMIIYERTREIGTMRALGL